MVALVDSRSKSAPIARHVKEDTSWWIHNPIIKLQLAYYFWEVHKGSLMGTLKAAFVCFSAVVTWTILLSFSSCLWCCFCPYAHSHFKAFLKRNDSKPSSTFPHWCWSRKRTTFPIFSFTLSPRLQGSSGVSKPLLSSWPFNNSYIVLTLGKALTKAF